MRPEGSRINPLNRSTRGRLCNPHSPRRGFSPFSPGVQPRAGAEIEIQRPLGPHPLAGRRVKGVAARPPLPKLGEGERGGRPDMGFSPGRTGMTTHHRIRTVGAHGRAPCRFSPWRTVFGGWPAGCGPVRHAWGLSRQPGIQPLSRQSLLVTLQTRPYQSVCIRVHPCPIPPQPPQGASPHLARGFSPGRPDMTTHGRLRTVGAHPGELFCVGGRRAKPAAHPRKTLSMHGARTSVPRRGADPSAAKV